MADVSHELGALRFVVESPLSSKVAMFNNAVSKHQESQHLNPFSQTGGLPKPTFKKGEYGKPLAGSLTEQRGQKANIHVLKEMLELCQIIDSEGYEVKDEPEMKVIPFGELFNIYTYISDKVVGILLRARKHKLVEFEGEVLFQHRDEDVPVFLLKPIKEIRKILTDKQDEIRRSVSPSPQATSVMLDQQKIRPSPSPSPTPKPKSKPSATKKAEEQTEGAKVEIVKPIARKANPVINVEDQSKAEVQNNIQVVTGELAPQESAVAPQEAAVAPQEAAVAPQESAVAPQEPAVASTPCKEETTTEGSLESEKSLPPSDLNTETTAPASAVPVTIVTPPTPTAESAPPVVASSESSGAVQSIPAIVEEKTDVNNNDEAPAIIITHEVSSITDNQSPADTTSTPTPQTFNS